MARAAYIELLDEKLRETASIVSAETRDRALTEALKAYSRVRPRRAVQKITGTGSAFTFDLASDFEEGLSSIEAIEYPVGEQKPVYLDADEYMLYRDQASGVLKLRLVREIIPAATDAYVNYTARHVVTDITPVKDTVPETDKEAVSTLAAALCLRQLAAYYSQTSNPSLAADVADYGQTAERYRALARALEAEYGAAVGINATMITAASTIGDLDVSLGENGGDRLFHRRIFR
jgi:hypothetical protein